MKKFLLLYGLLFILILCYYNTSFAFNIDIPTQNTFNEISSENVFTEAPEPVITEIAQSQRDELLTPANIINIILIVVGVVLILLGIAILIRCKQ